MSKMSQEFEKNLDNAKYDLYEACKEVLADVDKTGFAQVRHIVKMQNIIASIETLDNYH